MSKLASIIALVVGVAVVGPFISPLGVQAQTPDTVFSHPPTVGEAIESRDAATASLVEGPLPEGMSLQALGGLLKGLAGQNVSVMRGAQDIVVFRQASPAVVLLKTKEGSGSGVVLQNGLVLTNRHVVEGIGAVQIFFKPTGPIQGGQATEMRRGTVLAVDSSRDLAVITAESLPTNSKFLKIATRDDFEVGADVYAIGHPLGYNWTFTRGIISGLRLIEADGERYTAIQTQTPINPGNSGGPLLNTNLEVLGINTWGRDISSIDKTRVAGQEVTVARPAQGLNFAVSARDVRGFLEDVAVGKHVKLSLKVPSSSPGCSGQTVFNGRAKSNEGGLKTFSLRCDSVVDAWLYMPDDKSKPSQFHFDPDRTGKSSIVVHSNPNTGKWETSYWDFFHDRTFAVIGRHEDGKITPTRFEFARS
jgi:S1-C subfamily serine protease